MTKYTKSFNTKQTPQTSKVPEMNQVKNNAGGYVFAISPQKMLDRFLMLGSEGGTYYVGETKLTQENAQSIVALAKNDGINTVNRIVEVSLGGKAPKNDPAIFALALCCTFGDLETKKAAYNAITKVCRIGTHLFNFCNDIQNLRGWSRGLRNGVAKFYTAKSVDKVAYQTIKYRQRNGFTHRDVLRLCHASTTDEVKNSILRYAVGKEVAKLHPIIEAFETVQKSSNLDEVINLVKEHKLPWEALQTEHLKSTKVWSALLPDMPITALVRNLGRMTANGTLVSPLDENVKVVVNKLTNVEAITASRIHPMSMLVAIKTYSSGSGFRGNLSWSPITVIRDAMQDAFYASFDNVTPSGENYYIGLDISGSMGGYNAGGFNNISCREASAVMAMVTVRTEKFCELKGFTSGKRGSWHDCNMTDINISPRDDFAAVMRKVSGLPMGGTDCAKPMLDALEKKLKVDKFIIYTDNETWAGGIHPFQALEKYRKAINPNAKLIVCAMTPTNFSIANPNDEGMLDICGFDTATPNVISQF